MANETVLATATRLDELDRVYWLVLGGCRFKLSESSLASDRGRVQLRLRCSERFSGLTPSELVFGGVVATTVEDEARIDDYLLDTMRYTDESRCWEIEGLPDLLITLRVSHLDVTVLGME